MRSRRVLSVTLTLCLSLMGYTVPASSQSPVQMIPSVEFPILQLDKPVRFLNSDDLSMHIPSGAYLMTAPSPDTIQLTSTSTREVQNVHATTITHTESLRVPFPFFIEEAEEQGHLHLMLLLPDDQGMDAEGRWEAIQPRGIGDLNSSTFPPTQRYTGVIMQQGRVTVDDDFNEQEAVSSSALSRLPSKGVPFYGRVTLEQDRITLDSDAQKLLRKRCRFCIRTP
ncbi:MAG: hypothetical protein AB7T38_06315 [Nitrospirales bacterium]